MNNETKRNFKYPLHLQFFAEPTPPADPQPTDPPADPPKDPDKTFTQAELEDIIAKRLDRERKKYADYDELKTKLTDFEKAEEERKKAAMTEQERLEAEKAEALKKAQEAEDARTRALEIANQRLIHAEFKIAAKTAGIEYIDDALKLADLSAVSVDDSGNVTGVADVVKALVESKPFLVAQKKEPKIIGDPTDKPKDTQKTAEQLLKEAADKAKASGKLDDLAAYSKLKRELNL